MSGSGNLTEEERYIQQQESDRREQLRREKQLAALREQEREGIQAELNTTEAVAAEALELGFDAETAPVLPLIPLIQVAWADGVVSTAEERSVLDLAERHGVTKNTPPHNFLKRLLAEQPSDLFFERTNRVIAAMISSDPSSWVKAELGDMCLEVANASGGFFGLGSKVGKEESALIAELAGMLNLDS